MCHRWFTRQNARILIRKLFRYSLASVAGTIAGQGSLIFLTAAMGWPGVPANLTAVTFGAVPNYLVNRYWTWGRSGKNRLWGEVVPFWVMTLAGLGLSTLFVAYADRQWGTPLSISLASMAGFGVVWGGKFLVLDRILFTVHPPVDAYEGPDDPGQSESDRPVIRS